MFEFQRPAGVLAIALASIAFGLSPSLAAEREPAAAPSLQPRRVDDARHVRFAPKPQARAARAAPIHARTAASAKTGAASAKTGAPAPKPSAVRPQFAAPAHGAKPRPAHASASSRGVDRVATASAKSDASYGWLVTVNAKGAASPKWTGAQSYGFVGYPTLSFRRPGAPQEWSSPDDSLQYALWRNERFAIGPALAYRGGRYSANAPELAGVHKPRWSLEGGVFADAWIAPDTIRLRAEVRRGMRAKDGVNGSLGADYVMRVDKFTVAVGPRVKIGDNHFMANQFGVSAQDAARNPSFARHDPKAGVYAIGAYASATYKQNDNWSYTLHGGYDRLRGDAAKSPIISRSGSKDQWAVGAIVSYTFGWTGF
jgi:outer membrane scaffolding protein for murein synthesis (MipA/OmpV family)